jgi:hypothetical protein
LSVPCGRVLVLIAAQLNMSGGCGSGGMAPSEGAVGLRLARGSLDDAAR